MIISCQPITVKYHGGLAAGIPRKLKTLGRLELIHYFETLLVSVIRSSLHVPDLRILGK